MYAFNVRSEKTVFPPFLWSGYISGVLARPGGFQRRYRMSYDEFSQLCGLQEPTLRILHTYPSVHAVIVLHRTLRWLAGGSYDDISAVAMMSVPTFFGYVNSGKTALLACEELAIRFQTARDEMKAQCEAFATKSLEGVLRGCIRDVDGWLCKIKTPTKREAGHVTSFFWALRLLRYKCTSLI
ncbi:hypothetical protein JG688_00014727 [Phytophthora aleatoria]|uniref:Uncharacterized protein n=1 Tax=Phytophthora aleatoria TaxID=2496075 RepID=A0A8J5MDT6_9STRA|nr:hypothetical protein JG688_00014727 [Phytophthora aleatoria]